MLLIGGVIRSNGEQQPACLLGSLAGWARLGCLGWDGLGCRCLAGWCRGGGDEAEMESKRGEKVVSRIFWFCF